MGRHRMHSECTALEQLSPTCCFDTSAAKCNGEDPASPPILSSSNSSSVVLAAKLEMGVWIF